MARFGIIYRFISPSGKVYVGQTIRDLKARRQEHERDALVKNSIVHKAIRKYGNSLVWEVIYENVPIHLLGDMEAWCIASHQSFGAGYNAVIGGGSALGYKHTEHARRKMSLSRLGKPQKESTIAKRAKSLRGKKRSEEAKRKMSFAGLGRVMPQETKDKIRAANLAHVITEETRQRMRHAALRREQTKRLKRGA